MADHKKKDPFIEKLDIKVEGMQADRVNWEQHWQEISWYYLPRKSDIFEMRSPGEKRNERVFDASPIQFLEEFASSLHGMLVSTTSFWFRIESQDDKLNEDLKVRAWFDTVTKTMHDHIHDPSANFSNELDEFFLDIGAFGTATMDIMEGSPDSAIRFQSHAPSTHYIAENKNGIVDTRASIFMFSARQIKQKFGEDALSAKQEAEVKKNTKKEFMIINVIQPREDFDPEKKDSKNKPFMSVWYDRDEKRNLLEEGFEEFPSMTARWRKESHHTYGYSPAMNSLPDAKMLNNGMKVIIASAEKQLNPPLDVPHDGYVNKVKTFAGALNHRNRLGGDRIEPMFLVGDVNINRDIMNDTRESIKKAFFLDRLKTPEDPRMTLGQVLEIRRDKLRLMSPMLGRLQAELLSPLITRVFLLLQRSGLFPDVPKALLDDDKKEVSFGKIRYLSELAIAQSADEVDSIIQTLATLQPLAEIAPEIYDKIDLDKATDVVTRVLNFPVIALRDQGKGQEPPTVTGVRESRQEQLSRDAELENTERGADVGLKAAKAAEAEANAEVVE